MNYPSILAMGEVYNKIQILPCSFSKIQIDEILSDISKLETYKACQDTEIPSKNRQREFGYICDRPCFKF